MKKKIAIIGAGIAGLTLANLIKKYTDHDFMVYEREESLSLEEGYGIQLATNSIKILNQISFLKNFNLPEMKETKKKIKYKSLKFLKNYKNSISNLSLNINLYYKFSNKIPKSYNWYSLKNNKEFIPSFTKKIFNQVLTLF